LNGERDEDKRARSAHAKIMREDALPRHSVKRNVAEVSDAKLVGIFLLT